MTGEPAEGLEECVELGVLLRVDGLRAGGAVHVHHRRDPGVELRPYRVSQDHVVAVDAVVEVGPVVVGGQRGTERAPALTVLHLAVEPVPHVGEERAREDGPVAERARTDLHTPLKPADDLALGEVARDLLHHDGRAAVRELGLSDRRLHFPVGEGRTPVRVTQWLEDAHARLSCHQVRRAEGDAVVGRRGLHKDLAHLLHQRELAVHAAVHRDTTCEAERPGAGHPNQRPHQSLGDLLEPPLHVEGEVAVVGLDWLVAEARPPEQLDEPIGETTAPGSVAEVAHIGVHLELARGRVVGEDMVELRLDRSGVLPVRREPHELPLVLVGLEAQELGEGRVVAAEAVRQAEAPELLDPLARTVPHDRGVLLAAAVQREDRGLRKARAVVGARGVAKLVREEAHALGLEVHAA